MGARHAGGAARLTIAIAAALAAAACDAPTVPERGPVPSYDVWLDTSLAGGGTDSILYHWPSGHVLSLYVDPTNAPQDSDLAALVTAGMRQWVDATFYRDVRFRLTSDPADADVIVHHASAPFLVDFAGCTYPLPQPGTTFFCAAASGDSMQTFPLLAGGGGRVKMDVRVNRAAVPTDERFQALVTHELGHVLGLGGHSADPDDLLWGGLIVASRPTNRDRAALRWVLRQPVELRP
jgi:hypothetical protein